MTTTEAAMTDTTAIPQSPSSVALQNAATGTYCVGATEATIAPQAAAHVQITGIEVATNAAADATDAEDTEEYTTGCRERCNDCMFWCCYPSGVDPKHAKYVRLFGQVRALHHLIDGLLSLQAHVRLRLLNPLWCRLAQMGWFGKGLVYALIGGFALDGVANDNPARGVQVRYAYPLCYQ